MSTHETGNVGGSPPPMPGSRPPPLPGPTRKPWFRSPPIVISLLSIGVAAVLTLVVSGIFGTRSKNATSAQSEIPPGGVEEASESGVTHRRDKISRGPWSIHVARVDRTRKGLTFYSPIATGRILGVSRISEQADAIPPGLGRPLAGVNGDFYERDSHTYAGDPRGLQIVNGELVSDTSTVCVWFDPADNPHVDDVKGDFKVTWPDGRTTVFGLNEQRRPNMAVLYTPTYGTSTHATGGRDLILEREGSGPWLPLQASETYRSRVREVKGSADTRLADDVMVLSLGPTLLASLPEVAPGAVLQISTATTPELKGVKTAIGGGPTLIKNGRLFSAKSPASGGGGYSERSKYERHPRSAIGWNAASLFLVTVDGRQPGFSVGMTLAELAEYMVKLGCTEGMNLDGGVSAAMWMNGRIVSDPCQGERPVANSLFVLRKPDAP